MTSAQQTHEGTQMLYQEFSSITLTRHQGVMTLTLDRADKHNAFDASMIAEMRAAIALCAQSSDCRLLLIRANGKHFSAGADLNWMRSQTQMNYEQNLREAHELALLMYELDQLTKPTIALVQGAAYGGALGLICCCDIAVATTQARFCLSEVKLGLIPAVISPYVVRAMGQRVCRRYMLTAELFDATTAKRLNLIHEVNDDLDAASQPLTHALLHNSPQAMQAAKSLLSQLDGNPISQSMVTYTAEQIAKIRVSEEGQEGLSAFFEKRTPHWSQSQSPATPCKERNDV